MTISECLLQITDLTRQNLNILKTINESFHTRAHHLSTTLEGNTYTIPSYIALENKVNHLQDAFNNLVHAAEAGTAWYNIDGNSRAIEVRGYGSAPGRMNLKDPKQFVMAPNDLFKDMLSPQPLVQFDLRKCPADISQVAVKKVILNAPELVAEIQGLDEKLEWRLVRDILSKAKGKYTTYEKTYDLPAFEAGWKGEYIIKEVKEDVIDGNLENRIKVVLTGEEAPVKTNQDGTDKKPLAKGDYLTTWNGSAKLRVEEIAGTELTLLVVSGEYVNLIPNEDERYVSDYSVLKLYIPPTTNRVLSVPLEEDRYVFIAVAPYDSHIHMRADWGTGVLIDTENLTGPEGKSFREYYNDNVRNIGDALQELTVLSSPALTKYSPAHIDAIQSKVEMTPQTLQVVQINKHLNDSEAVKNIRTLYSQKKQYQHSLNEIYRQIDSLTDELNTTSFDDVSGVRASLTTQIADLKSQQNKIIVSINKVTDTIAKSANNAEIPIEAAKFRIRGYVNIDSFLEGITKNNPGLAIDELRTNIRGIRCRYRYKNADIPQANVSVVDGFLFTDWNLYEPPTRARQFTYKNGVYEIIEDDLVDSGGKKVFDKARNENKFNQVDIPITQGESVELQVQVLWYYGFPYASLSTEWSDSLTIEFPEELIKDVQVTTIIEENNSDIEANRFERILTENGVTKHVDDSIQDQDVTYFHKPENISSGFYTEERRVIPLKDKLLDINNKLVTLMDSVQGTFSESLLVTFTCDNVETELMPDIENIVHLPAYNSISETGRVTPTGTTYKPKQNGPVFTTGQIKVYNRTNHTIRLFPIIPGPRDKDVSANMTSAFSNEMKEIWTNGMITTIYKKPNGTYENSKQKCNQVGLFCSKNPYNLKDYAGLGGRPDSYSDEAFDGVSDGIYYYPSLTTPYALCIDSDAVSAHYDLAPQDSFIFPVAIAYKCVSRPNASTTIGLSIRPSLYRDPLYYECKLVAKQDRDLFDDLTSMKDLKYTRLNTTLYRPVTR